MTTVPELQHALTAPPIRDLPTDLAKRYQAKLEGYRADFEPRGTLENDLVAEMAHLVLQLEQARAVAAALAAIRVETAAVGQGTCRDDRDARLAALHLQTLAFDARPEGGRLRRHYDACERRCTVRSPHSSSSARPPPSPDALPPNPSASTPAPDRSTLVPALRARRAKSSGSPTHPSTSPATAFRPPRRIDEFNSTAGDAGPDGVVTPRAVIADGPAGYHDGTTAGRAGEFASAPPTPPARTKRTTSAIRARTPTPRSNSSSKPPWPTNGSRRLRQSPRNGAARASDRGPGQGDSPPGTFRASP